MAGWEPSMHALLRDFYVVTMVSNPERYASRYALYHKFREHMRASSVPLLTVEVAFGERPFAVTSSDDPWSVQLRTCSQIWHKENALNIGISRLPSDWKYVAWIDADIAFVHRDWALETVHQLQHTPVVQMFQHAIDLGPNHETLQMHQGFVWCYRSGRPSGRRYAHWHPGYAWAARRDAFDGFGGLIDWAILGSADHHMAVGLIGRLDRDYCTPRAKLSDRYQRKLEAWQTRAVREVKRNIGFVPGTILHSWHGKKADRRYGDRWSILTSHHYDPDLDLARDWQGLYRLTDHNPGLRDAIRGYFRVRNEDSIDLA
jgi:hypothetical protein